MSTTNNYKTSLLIRSQLPEYIRDDPSYSKFIDFVEAYYEWMDSEDGELHHSKNLLSYKDIDTTTDKFIDYFYNDFLTHFPQDVITDKNKLVKIAKNLYDAKGTFASFKFLFRVLYNSDVDFFNTKEVVLRASSGKWFIAKSLKLSSDNLNFLKTNNLRIFGETTKSIATIENSVVSKNKIEIFISNIERLFQSGEYVRIVDSNNQDVLFDGEVLRSKIVGQISNININPKYRGERYKSGDPVIVYGGLNSIYGHGATATIKETTKGSIQRIYVVNGGYGFRELLKGEDGNEIENSANANTIVQITNGGGSIASVLHVNPAANGIVNVATIPIDTIGYKKDIRLDAEFYNFRAKSSANINCTLANAFTFTGFSTYPLSTIRVDSGGGDLSDVPEVKVISRYDTEGRYNDPNFEANNNFKAVLSNLGILSPIQISSGGTGYVANDVIQVLGGSGIGAFAEVSNVSSSGAITSVNYVANSNFIYPIGGSGYKTDALPTLNVISTNGQGASLYVPGILGSGEKLSIDTDRIGNITNFNIIDYGEDYISTPNVSLKIQDFVVTGISLVNPPKKGDIVYQGSSVVNSSYKAYVDSINLLVSDNDPLKSLHNLRVYNYNTTPNFDQDLKIDNIPNIKISNPYSGFNLEKTRKYNEKGFISYGDGTAKATAKFLNGLVISDGVYLDDTGHPSAFNILQNEDYNNYTYQITLEKELSKYKNILLNLLHPTGMKVIGRFAMNSNNTVDMNMVEALDKGHTLDYYISTSSLTIETSFTNHSNNIIKFNGVTGSNIENYIYSGDIISFTTNNGEYYSSTVLNTTNSHITNQITISDNVFLTFANVANITASSGSKIINISTLTNSYDIINNGNYTDPDYPLKDIVKVGDIVLIANNTERTVSNVDYINNIITVDSNFTHISNSLLSVRRVWTAIGKNIKVFGPVGIQYIPEITDELGNSITTEDGNIILLG